MESKKIKKIKKIKNVCEEFYDISPSVIVRIEYFGGLIIFSESGELAQIPLVDSIFLKAISFVGVHDLAIKILKNVNPKLKFNSNWIEEYLQHGILTNKRNNPVIKYSVALKKNKTNGEFSIWSQLFVCTY